MRHGFTLAALLLPLSACYVAPPYGQPGYGYAQPGYAQPAYAQPGYPGAPTDAYGNVYPGYAYNDGSPTLFVEGATEPLISFGGAWGYYDGRHEFHRAPDAVGRHLEQQRASGGFRSGGGGFPQGRPGGGEPYRGQAQFRGAEPVRPAAAGFAAPRAAPAAAAQPAHEERRRGCEPGQRC